MVNPDCELVRKQFCAASVDVVKASLEAPNLDLARQQKQDFVHKYGCPAAQFEQLLPQ